MMRMTDLVVIKVHGRKEAVEQVLNRLQALYPRCTMSGLLDSAPRPGVHAFMTVEVAGEEEADVRRQRTS